MRIKIDVSGIEHVKAKLGSGAADDLERAIDLDIGVETRNMANDAADRAPIETGALKASIRYSVRREGKMQYYFGSWLPYALRQEYEHKSKSPFFRTAYWDGWKPTERTLMNTIKRRLGG